MIRVFPRRTKWTPTDPLAFSPDAKGIGADPPLDLPPEQPIRISTTFTWDIPEAKRLFRAWNRHFSDVQIGGPAFDDPGGEFDPGLFVPEGMVVTSRGCPKNCPWCLVPLREGTIRELTIKSGWNIFDNNLLACGRDHIEAVFEMLRNQKKAARFSGGLDVTLLKSWHIDLLKSISKDRLYFACDTQEALPVLETAADLLSDFSRNLKYCYVLVGLNGESLEEAESRLIQVFLLGFMPMAMFYRGLDAKQKTHVNPEWRKLIRKWCAPGRYKAFMRTELNWQGD